MITRESTRRVTVYCGSSSGSQRMLEAAHDFGATLASEGLGLVFGGGGIGMMKAVADGALAHGGEVIGVIPSMFGRELAHPGVQRIEETDDLPSRKKKMFELGDAFVALPGGLGTVEELLEVLDWARLSMHRKPIGLLDVDGYYSLLMAFLDQMTERGFCTDVERSLLQVDTNGMGLIARLRAHRAPAIPSPQDRY